MCESGPYYLHLESPTVQFIFEIYTQFESSIVCICIKRLLQLFFTVNVFITQGATESETLDIDK